MEIWNQLIGYENKYEVSNTGLVRIIRTKKLDDNIIIKRIK